MDKELALALQFGEAPKELQDVALKYQEQFLRLEKANNQVSLWLEEASEARKAQDQAQKEFRKGVNQWLEKNRSKKKEEITKPAKEKQ